MRRVAALMCWLVGWTLGCDDGESFRPLPTVDMEPGDAFVLPDAGERDMRTAPTDDFGEPCDENADCQSNFCVAVSDGRACSRRCGDETDCPEDWFCAQVTNPGADVTFICVPNDAPCAGADLTSDVEHCGFCDNTCSFPAAEPRCVDGVCRMGDCTAGAVDLDGDPTNGCEYACTPTLDGNEACDGIDNDCDGATDEGIDTQTDLAHCGGCGMRCAPANATASCVDGGCQLDACLDGFIDVDGDPTNGCEVGCAPSNGGVEACDTIDNDCDGAADEGFDLQTDPIHCGACNQPCALANAEARCDAGVCVFEACVPDFYDRNADPSDGCEVGCQRSNGGVEICDAIDNDCDGPVDEGFDLQSDVRNCGACGEACARPNAMRACVEGTCRALACVDGFYDLDGVVDNGCEYACERVGDEICDGADDDCDGRVDEGFDLQSDLDNCGQCGRVCAPENAGGVCAEGACGIDACDVGFVNLDRDVANGCEYACVLTGRELCNQVDEDCDGRVDEGYDLQSDVNNCGACDRVCALDNAVPRCGMGACRVAECAPGFFDADRVAMNGCECQARREACDLADNDCDGRVDEGFDLNSDLENCGACGRGCDPANAAGLCANGQCRIDLCDGGWRDADRDPDNGCECRVQFETCDMADNDCDGRVDEDFDLDFDVNNCGGCGQRCEPANAIALCVGRQCRIDECLPGFVDGDDDPANGCELDCGGADAADPACGGGGPDIEYDGTYRFEPPFRYACNSIFGDQVVFVNSNQLTFRVQGDALLIDGLNVQMRMSPGPDDADFSASGIIAGDCQETFLLDASYIDADTWRGTMQLQFAGLTCGFTDCMNVSFQVEGQRLP